MRIRLAENFRALFYAPFYATHVLGFYAGEGIVVDLFNSPAPASAAAGLLDGSIDISWGGPMRVMKARDLDPASPLVCFCEVAARDPFFLVGKCERSGFYLADLPRLKVATVSEVPTPWLCLQHDLRERGVDPGRINRVTDRTMGDKSKGVAQRRSRRGADVRAVRVDGPAGGRGRHPLCREQPRANRLYDVPDDA